MSPSNTSRWSLVAAGATAAVTVLSASLPARAVDPLSAALAGAGLLASAATALATLRDLRTVDASVSAS